MILGGLMSPHVLAWQQHLAVHSPHFRLKIAHIGIMIWDATETKTKYELSDNNLQC